MKSEDTIYDPRLNNQAFSPRSTNSFGSGSGSIATTSNGPTLVQVGTAAVSGLVIGGVAMALTSFTDEDNTTTAEDILDSMPDDEILEEEMTEEEKEYTSTGGAGHYADDEIEFATGINEDMSFAEAFSAARAEVGPGGAFVWHGNIYGTYTASEWNAMSPAEQAEYTSHFDWNNISSPNGTTATTTEETGSEEQTVATGSERQDEEEHSNGALPPEDSTEPEVEVIEIVANAETGQSYVEMRIDGHEAYFIDEDGDGTYDTLVADLNDNQQLDEGETIDISASGLTLEDVAAESGIEITYIGGEEIETEDPEVVLPGDDPTYIDEDEDLNDLDIDITDEEALDI